MRSTRKTVAILHHSLVDLKKTYYSKEHFIADDDTSDIIAFVKKTLEKHHYKVQEVKIIGKDISVIKHIKADFIFNFVDSKSLEMRIARILDRMSIPHSGSSYQALYVSNNKIKSKSMLVQHRIPTPKYFFIRLKDRLTRSYIPSKFPLMLKPAFEHASVGISIHSVVTNFEQMKMHVKEMKKKHRQTIICEEFIQGKELHVTVLEKQGETIALPPSEMMVEGSRKSNKWNIYGFREKWNKDTKMYKILHFVSPPRTIPPHVVEEIRRDAIRAFYAFGFKDYARFDVRYNPKTELWYFLEGNANPGICLQEDDAMTAAIRAYGMTLEDFIMQLVRNGLPS